MKLVRRILTTVVVTLAVIFVAVRWIGPVALSFYEARKVPSVARIIPTELKDISVSQAPGMKLSYLGYELEIPWTDLDEARTTLYPKDKPEKTRVVLTFRSGLRLMVTAVPAREFADEFTKEDFKMSPAKFEAVFGRGTATSDYTFVRNVYEFTPAKMHYWSLSDGVHYREQIVLMIKSIMPVKAAETGIFYVQNHDYKGFQQGDPTLRKDNLALDLYSDDNHLEIIFLQEDYRNPMGVSQPEINRIIQSVQRSVRDLAASRNN
ncbi:MAG: hypothetical protein ABR921_21555 [Candidatus Sulfotelmatobacter sp.]|jgi:hypothetical protein